MMSSNLRQRVLESFKALHKSRKSVFKEDANALREGRKKINEEYKKNKNVSDVALVEEMINKAIEVEKVLRTCVIQAKKIDHGKYRAEITKDTLKLDNVPFKDSCDMQK